jgi:hypothetical protein
LLLFIIFSVSKHHQPVKAESSPASISSRLRPSAPLRRREKPSKASPDIWNGCTRTMTPRAPRRQGAPLSTASIIELICIRVLSVPIVMLSVACKISIAGEHPRIDLPA